MTRSCITVMKTPEGPQRKFSCTNCGHTKAVNNINTVRRSQSKHYIAVFHGTLFFSHFCEDHERHCVALAGSLLMIRMLQMAATDGATVETLMLKIKLLMKLQLKTELLMVLIMKVKPQMILRTKMKVLKTFGLRMKLLIVPMLKIELFTTVTTHLVLLHYKYKKFILDAIKLSDVSVPENLCWIFKQTFHAILQFSSSAKCSDLVQSNRKNWNNFLQSFKNRNLSHISYFHLKTEISKHFLSF